MGHLADDVSERALAGLRVLKRAIQSRDRMQIDRLIQIGVDLKTRLPDSESYPIHYAGDDMKGEKITQMKIIEVNLLSLSFCFLSSG